ncbi:MAG: NAD(P)H-binding protein [Lachnospiraceae bacterium]|nr:NAD(P)H-binding protein [Lachnospiraceae bacterium]
MMKIALIGSSGKLGSVIARQALDKGIGVKGFQRSANPSDERIELVRKSLFDITRGDLADCDAVLSAFGSGFKADPAINCQAFLKYIELNEGLDRHLVAIGGAGSLYTDETHTLLSYEAPEHPEFLREISRNIKLGIDELKKTTNVKWTVVCPSAFFDESGSLTGNYVIGTEGHLLYNSAGKSRVTYPDLADAMLKIALEDTYQKQVVTVLTV